MTPDELSRSRTRLASQFPTVSGEWIAAVIDNTIDLIGRTGVVPGPREVEAIAGECLRLRDTIG